MSEDGFHVHGARPNVSVAKPNDPIPERLDFWRQLVSWKLILRHQLILPCNTIKKDELTLSRARGSVLVGISGFKKFQIERSAGILDKFFTTAFD